MTKINWCEINEEILIKRTWLAALVKATELNGHLLLDSSLPIVRATVFCAQSTAAPRVQSPDPGSSQSEFVKNLGQK